MIQYNELEEFLAWAEKYGHWYIAIRYETFKQYQESESKRKLIATAVASGIGAEE